MTNAASCVTARGLPGKFKLHGGLPPLGPPARADGQGAGGDSMGPFGVAFFILLFFFLYFLVCSRPREVSHRFKHKTLHRMHSESCLGTPWGLSYVHICKNLYF